MRQRQEHNPRCACARKRLAAERERERVLSYQKVDCWVCDEERHRCARGIPRVINHLNEKKDDFLEATVPTPGGFG